MLVSVLVLCVSFCSGVITCVSFCSGVITLVSVLLLFHVCVSFCSGVIVTCQFVYLTLSKVMLIEFCGQLVLLVIHHGH